MDAISDVLQRAEKDRISFIQLQFMDILGVVKSVSIPMGKLEKALEDGVLFDGSSIVGYATIDESDMRALPDPSTYQTLPWSTDDKKSARLICNIYTPKGERFAGDPRYALERAMERAMKKGYVLHTGPECEFFLLKLDARGRPTVVPDDSGGYFDQLPLDRGECVRGEIVQYLEQMGFEVETSHHEVAPGQHEIDFRYADAMITADRVFTLKHVTKAVALRHDLYATFMPKPIYGVCGSGMHAHLSLITPEGENVFYDPKGRWEVSELALHFLGGLIHYAKDICAVLASWANSYKRLVPGYEAPVYISWANLNRSALVRIPLGRGVKTRLELRNPDPAGNAYLQFAAILDAGLRGIEEGIEPPEPVERDIYGLTPDERETLKIDSLPGDLGHALLYMRESELVRATLGNHIFEHFLYIKGKEWDEYRSKLSQWEIDEFLSIL